MFYSQLQRATPILRTISKVKENIRVSCHQMRYCVLDFVFSPDKALPDGMDRCLIGPRGMIHKMGNPSIIKKKKKKNTRLFLFGLVIFDYFWNNNGYMRHV